MNSNENASATTNAILVILLVLVAGFIVWFVTTRGDSPAPADSGAGPSLEVNLEGGTGADGAGGSAR